MVQQIIQRSEVFAVSLDKMDINSIQYLGPSGNTLSMEERAAMQVSLLQRSREVGSEW